VVDVAKSPKFHWYVDAPVAVFVNAKLLPLKHWLLLLIVNPETGCGLTVTVLEIESLQPYVVVATSFTVNVLAVV